MLRKHCTSRNSDCNINRKILYFKHWIYIWSCIIVAIPICFLFGKRQSHNENPKFHKKSVLGLPVILCCIHIKEVPTTASLETKIENAISLYKIYVF